MRLIRVAVAGEIVQGKPLYPSNAKVVLPSNLIEPSELVYKLRSPVGEIPSGAYLVAEPRDRAHTGELVLARLGDLVYLGRFWGKHGLREIRTEGGTLIVESPAILASINQIVSL